MRIWLLSVFLSLYFTTAFAEVPGLVFVRAKVQDEGTLQETTREGTGTIVKKAGRFYVLTAAHVSLGRKPTLTSSGETLEIIGRAIDPGADVDWFEIREPKTAKPLISWNDRYRSFLLDKKIYPEDTTDMLSTDCTWLDPHAKPNGLCDASLYSPPSILKEAASHPVPLVYLTTSNQVGRAVLSPYLEAVTGRIILPTFMRKGDSGSPLFWKIKGHHGISVWKLVGVAQSFDIYFPFSYYGVNFLPAFRKVNDREYEMSFPMKVSWRLRYGLTFLDFGDGIKEVAMARSHAGTGGLTDDGGTGGLTDDGGRDGGSAGDAFDSKKIQPGIEVDGKSCVAFRSSKEDVFFADRSVVQSLVNGSIPRSNCVLSGSELQQLLYDRLTSFSGKKVAANMEMVQENGAKIELLDEGIDVRLPLSNFEGKREGWIWFTLDRNGGYQGQPFRPVISVPGLKSERYVVDLRGLYFTVIGGGPAIPKPGTRAQPIFIQAMIAGRKSKEPVLEQFMFNEPRAIQLRKTPKYEP